MFKFYTPASRVVYFHIGKEISLHNFKTGEWVITVMIGNQHIEVPRSYILSESENPGDPRLPGFEVNLESLANKFKRGIGFRSDSNAHRAVFPGVCDLSSPFFRHGEDFSNYSISFEEYEKKKKSM